MNKKRGFALIESIFMIVFLSVALLIVYKAFATSFQDERRRINYDNTSSLYKTYFLKQYLEENNILTYLSTATFTNGYLVIDCDTLTSVNTEYCDFLISSSNFDIKKIYITKYDMDGISYTNLEPTTIDYFRTLSGTDTTSYRVIVWYNNDEYASLKLGDPFYTLNVILDGGTWNGETPQRIVSGDTTEILNPTKEGYIFTGWSVIGAGSGIVGTTFTMGGEDTVLLATWADNKLYNVRYVKDCINGSSANASNHWVELQAIKEGTNVALGKTVTGTVPQHVSPYLYSRIVDGDTTSANYAEASSTGLQCITVDLTQAYNLDEIKIWHYWADGRTYYSNTTYVSSDNTNWKAVIANTNAETSSGKSVLSSNTSTVVPIYRISNLLTNNSFENTGWSGGAYNTTYKKYGSYSLALTGTTSTAEVVSVTSAVLPTSLDNTHIYYARVEGYQTTKAGSAAQIYWPIAEPAFGSVALGNASSWNLYSYRATKATFTNGTYQFRVDYDNANVAGVMYFDGAALIDLTATFGAGKEPSKAWCDANLTYFDGTQNFYLTP